VKKKRVVCFLNQFFGQIGGEEQAGVGFSVAEGPLGPSALVQSLLGDFAEVVATVICGDNYLADSPETAVPEALALIEKYEPDLFFAGPAFNAGRYGLNCGRMCKEVASKFGVPTVTGMYHENPAIEIYRKDTYIVLSGISAGEMKAVVTKMTSIGKRLVTGEHIGSAKDEGYMKRDIIKNEFTNEVGAVRAINMLLKKVKGEPFETEMTLPTFDIINPAPPVVDIEHAKIALVSDGGVVPEGNPDKIRPFSSTTWGEYDLEDLFNRTHEVQHAGYDGTYVMQDLNRLLPLDAMEELKEEGAFGELFPNVFMAGGNCAGINASKDIGKDIAQRLKDEGITAAILTST